MPRTPSPWVRTTLYRLVELQDLQLAIKPKYLEREGFFQQRVEVGGRDALLFYGSMITESVSWADRIHQLTGVFVDMGNRNGAAVLLIPNKKAAWALTYGMGFQLLDDGKVDPGFGQRVVIRTANIDSLNSLTRTTLDHRSRTDRFSIPGGEHLRGFGVGEFGELVTRMVGKARIEGITADDAEISLRGADALSLPLAREPHALVADLDVIESVLSRGAPPILSVLEQLSAIKHQPGLTERLDAKLGEWLAGNSDVGRVALSWPHERVDENGTPSSFTFVGVGRGRVRDGVPELHTILEQINGLGAEECLNRIESVKLILFKDADGDEPISSAIPLRRWLAFETTDEDGRRYCLHDGAWYRMASGYADKLSRRVAEIFARDAGINLPEWPSGEEFDEAGYNKFLAKQLGGVVLDRKLVRTEFHRRGIELCDVLLNDGTMIHVKSVDKSAPASHLLAQALVSADALLFDDEAFSKFGKIVKRSGLLDHVSRQSIERVVLGIARKGRPISPDDLFTFTQVNLVRQVAALESKGVDVFVVPIIRS